MSFKAPISLCLIAKNEEKNIEECLKSIRDYVEEIVFVDTGSTDNTIEIAKKYADKVEVYTACNGEDGKINSFSDARNYSFSLASKEWVMWCDADDIIKNGEHLKKIVEEYSKPEYSGQNISVLFPYEYSHDHKGNVTCYHFRERLVHPKQNFKWHGPVHEVLMADNSHHKVLNDVTFVHRRGVHGKITDPHRNFRIIKKLVDEIGDSDPRQLYYLGLEYGNIGEIDNAINTLSRYVELTGWDDEKFLAELTISTHYMHLGINNSSPILLNKAIEWANKCLHTKETWGEGYFHLGKIYYHLALLNEKDNKPGSREWEKCIHFIKLGLSLPPTQTTLFINPIERSVDVHRYLNMALGRIGQVSSAIESCNAALSVYSDDQQFLGNKKIYETALSKSNIFNELIKLKQVELINDDQKDQIMSIINGDDNSSSKSVENWANYHRPEGYPKNIQDKDFPVAKITPHSQAWGIPEKFVRDDLPLKMTDAQLQAMIGTIWHQFMLHDEVLSAISFLENAPYRVRHSAETEDLLMRTKKTIAWISNHEEYDKDNTPQDPNGNALTHEMVPLPGPLHGQAWARMQWMTDRMPDKSKTLLDMACIDGEMSNRWGLMGYKVTGLDMCTNSIKIANEKATEFNTGANHIQCYFKDAPGLLQGKKFDYITCGDVYEHLLDPINDLLIPARNLIKEDGKMVFVAPHGAWFRGQFAAHAHPWLWANEGLPWNAEKNRGHVIAPTVWTVAENFRKAGWWVNNCTAVAQWYQDVPDQGNVCVEAYPVAPGDLNNSKDIIIYVGEGYEDWTPHTVDITGIGGSELAVINMSKQLVQLGHKVRVYSSCGKWGEGIYSGVEYYHSEKYHDLECDVLVVSRYAPALSENLNVKAKTRLLWVHDVWPIALKQELSLRADKILALTQWHKKCIMEHYSFVDESQIYITQNGLDLTRFDVNVERNPHKAIYSSSPDRALPVLLDVWPKIRETVTDAELHIFYGFYNWKKSAANNPAQTKNIEELIKKIESMKEMGVHYHDRVNQNELARQFKSSGVWIYPTWFSETYCITSAEAQMAGLGIVTSSIAALNETVGPRGALIDGDWLSKDYQDKFIKESIDAMLNTSEEKRQALTNYAKENFDWIKVAKDWDKLINELMSNEFSLVPFKV
jgi:glycosyltransferase involved in cell wall biosynthesis